MSNVATLERFFAGRDLLIATQHKKEGVIGPLLENRLKLNCHVTNGYDTDMFGTFSGEIERNGSPFVTVRRKCVEALNRYGFDLGVASEGSFGMHPRSFMLQANEEVIVFMDLKHKIEIYAKLISFETNFNAKVIQSYEDLGSFARQSGFPTHGIILKASKDVNHDLIKGINTWDMLENGFRHMMSRYGKVYAETDMRAHQNPTRMKVIGEVTLKLIDLIESQCPACHFPGFSIVDVKAGLPCKRCQAPTNSVSSHIYICKKCNHELEIKFPRDKFYEDPMYCDVCNP